MQRYGQNSQSQKNIIVFGLFDMIIYLADRNSNLSIGGTTAYCITRICMMKFAIKLYKISGSTVESDVILPGIFCGWCWWSANIYVNNSTLYKTSYNIINMKTMLTFLHGNNLISNFHKMTSVGVRVNNPNPFRTRRTRHVIEQVILETIKFNAL